MHKPCGQPWGEGGSWNVHFTNKAYLVILSTKGEGGQKSPKNGPHGLCMAPYEQKIEGLPLYNSKNHLVIKCSLLCHRTFGQTLLWFDSNYFLFQTNSNADFGPWVMNHEMAQNLHWYWSGNYTTYMRAKVSTLVHTYYLPKKGLH